MKPILLLLLLFITGCGPYTNFPAQIRVKSLDPSSAVVSFQREAVGISVQQINNPVLTLQADPGSIGATYTVARILYSDGAGQRIAILGKELGVTIRVPPSTFIDAQGKVVLGVGSSTLPIVNKEVVAFAVGNSGIGALVADITLEGTDDAKWPADLTLSVPILFQELKL